MNLPISEVDMGLSPLHCVKDPPNKEGPMNSISLFHLENSIIESLRALLVFSYGYLLALTSPQAIQGPILSSLMLIDPFQSSLLIIGSQEAYTTKRNLINAFKLAGYHWFVSITSFPHHLIPHYYNTPTSTYKNNMKFPQSSILP